MIKTPSTTSWSPSLEREANKVYCKIKTLLREKLKEFEFNQRPPLEGAVAKRLGELNKNNTK
jgi:hypothetical protein